MLAGYNTRRTSVVLNPRGRVLGRLGEEGGGGDASGPGEGNGGETGGGSNAPGEGGNIPGGGGYAEAAAAEAFVASQMADEAALAAAAQALAAGRASNAASAKIAATIATGAVGFFGPIGMIAGLIGKATGFVDRAFENALNGQQLSYDKNISDANQALEGARGYAGDNAVINTEINKVQYNLDMVKKASIEAAVTQMFQTYAKRNPDPAALAYWSQRFGPTITADEVMQFQQVLYANEPNLRPVAVTTQTAAQSSNNLALPIIAAIAGYFIFGA